MSATTTRVMPGPLPPTQADVELWNALSREEQIARYRESLSEPACDRESGATVSEILAEARARCATA